MIEPSNLVLPTWVFESARDCGFDQEPEDFWVYEHFTLPLWQMELRRNARGWRHALKINLPGAKVTEGMIGEIFGTEETSERYQLPEAAKAGEERFQEFLHSYEARADLCHMFDHFLTEFEKGSAEIRNGFKQLAEANWPDSQVDLGLKLSELLASTSRNNRCLYLLSKTLYSNTGLEDDFANLELVEAGAPL
jgi:hypothetical protein